MPSLSKIAPLVATPRAVAFDNPGWLFELKYDGFRALLEIDGNGARLVSRNRNRFRHLDTLAAALAKRLRVSHAILDGEVCCVDETGCPIFVDLLRRKEPCFVAFDLLWLNGEDLRPLAPCRTQDAPRAATVAALQSSHCRSNVNRGSRQGADGGGGRARTWALRRLPCQLISDYRVVKVLEGVRGTAATVGIETTT